MNNIAKKVAVYARVSTNSQSTQAQIETLTIYCQQRNFKIYKVYEDIASGSKDQRPALKELMIDARKRKIDCVLVFRFDRWSRSIRHLTLSLEEFKTLGINFISYSEAIDTSTPMGFAVFNFISVMAQLERDIIRERVLCGLENAKRKGKKLGRPKKRSDHLIINLRKQGLSYRAIAKQLGVSLGSVQQALKNKN